MVLRFAGKFSKPCGCKNPLLYVFHVEIVIRVHSLMPSWMRCGGVDEKVIVQAVGHATRPRNFPVKWYGSTLKPHPLHRYTGMPFCKMIITLTLNGLNCMSFMTGLPQGMF
jgi:hypothetical protein